ncbi:hypothetical protein [Spongiimicrobium salis]|uniref:hypothetical protein n=1 Tax=Spongiimicrobium salis TaxID=1667022 RepID=UPI00374CD20A
MKLHILIALSALFISCSNDKKPSEIARRTSTLKSDILLQSTFQKPFSDTIKDADYTLTVSGESLLQGTATLKVTDGDGKELQCHSFPASQLIQEDYRSANSVLKEAHLKEVVEGFFVEEARQYAKTQNIAMER